MCAYVSRLGAAWSEPNGRSALSARAFPAGAGTLPMGSASPYLTALVSLAKRCRHWSSDDARHGIVYDPFRVVGGCCVGDVGGNAMSDNPVGRILVGLDGSEGSAAALRWAIDLAKVTGSEILAAHAFELPATIPVPMAGGAPLGVAAEASTFEESVRESVRSTFRTDWCAPLESSGVRYRELFGDGRAGPALVDAAERENADLIVTGRRGRTALAEVLAGSVSQYLVHRARPPVVVIPSGSEQETPATA